MRFSVEWGGRGVEEVREIKGCGLMVAKAGKKSVTLL